MKRIKMGILVVVLFVLLSDVSCFAGMFIDHTAVDLYDDIPQQYIDEVKKMWVNIPGESHSSGYRKGLAFLAEQNPLYAVVVTESGSPEPYREDALRISGRVRNQYNNWSGGIGESGWYANADSSNVIPDHLDYCNNNNLEIAAIGFGWCWDMAWHNGAGGGIDPVHQVRWAGSSVGGPEGDMRWGLDDGDYTLTGNSVNMNTYLNATQVYLDYIQSQGYATKMLFTTGPVEGSCANGERGYQRYLKHEHLRTFVGQNPDRILFDYADILNWNNAGEQSLTTWTRGSEFGSYANTSETFPRIHSDNARNFDGSTTEDGDHIGEVGALRLGKAIWVMMAKIAGWDGSSGGNIAPTARAGINQTVTDTDRSGSEQVTLDGRASSDTDGNIVSYIWQESVQEIGSGVELIRDFSVGTHVVVLTVTDNDGAKGNDTVIITVNNSDNQPPSASFTVNTQTGQAPLEVIFDASEGSDDVGIQKYQWDFEDDNIIDDEGMIISHTYDDAGTYTAVLTVEDSFGLKDSTEMVITVISTGEIFEEDVYTEDKLNVSNNIIKAGNLSPVVIECQLKEPGNLSVKIYNAKGKEIISLHDGYFNQTLFSDTWGGTDKNNQPVGSGIYMVHIKSGKYEETKKIVVIK